MGARPVASPLPGVDAYLWIKPPGESDGASSPILNEGPVREIERYCDPTALTNDRYPTNALADAPSAGRWHHEQFAMLVRNAHPAL